MANPAELLHEILTGWLQDSDKAIYLTRQIPGEEFLMQTHRRAILLIGEIDQIVSGMDLTASRRDSIQRNLAKWTKWVFAYPHNWLGGPDQAYPNLQDRETLDALDLVAHLLDGHVAKIDEKKRASYLENIEEIIAALKADATLPAELRNHIYTIAAHARQCVEEYEITGDFAVQAAVERLAAAVQTAIVVSQDSGAWAKFKDKFVYPTVASLVASGPQLALAASALPGGSAG
jgi:hypothetical protein